MTASSAIYEGYVVHKRVRPVRHALRYRVFSLLLDCAALDDLDARLRFFSLNRFNLFSLYEADHGDGKSLQAYLHTLAKQSGVTAVERFMMLCYPRMLGYGFNPVTVYFGLGNDGVMKLAIFEVNNTFGQRQTYVCPVNDAAPEETASLSCEKTFYVSPFNNVDGRYQFHLTPLGEDITVGIALHTDEGPLLKAHFRAERKDLSDGALVSAFARIGWLSVKVVAAIHFEAAKLWFKGLRLVERPKGPKTAVSITRLSEEQRSR